MPLLYFNSNIIKSQASTGNFLFLDCLCEPSEKQANGIQDLNLIITVRDDMCVGTYRDTLMLITREMESLKVTSVIQIQARSNVLNRSENSYSSYGLPWWLRR